ncbi:sensor histidine kinase [Isobaculum melis]|uniref:histidine kinase n=1 Tax=Isobaculum melis TaxID=142588 RepID=A0A1H9Q058_9LACT|nr:HAMP domain-containing sensor histidine kinase [Isobaculum melis]SER53223.1 HAMP domain-containing protein [Isobaculum melis]
MKTINITHNKIAKKLLLYFGGTLLFFSFIIGVLFTLLFRSHTLTIHQQEMKKQGNAIAASMAEYMEDSHKGMMGQRRYLQTLDDVMTGDVWLIDKNHDLITADTHNSGHMGGMMNDSTPLNYQDLPENASQVIENALQGEASFNEEFNTILKTPALTFATPICSANGKILGVVLLHSPITNIASGTTAGLKILGLSMLIGLGLSTIVTYWLAHHFTHPLNKMNETTKQLADGKYDVKTQIAQNDEIGELAQSIDQLSMTLYDASLETEKLAQLRASFIANISHELKTPITVIRGFLESLQDGVVTNPKDVASYHQQMLAEVLFLQRLVGDLLDLSKLQHYEFAIKKEAIDIASLIQDLSRSLKPLLTTKQLQLLVSFEEEQPLVEGDYGRLRQLLMILLDNAVRYSPISGMIKIKLYQGALEIQDQGPGIPIADQPYIFDRFYKARDESNKKGTGLGLAIAKEIAKRHDMDLTVSATTEGTTFRLIY